MVVHKTTTRGQVRDVPSLKSLVSTVVMIIKSRLHSVMITVIFLVDTIVDLNLKAN